MAYKVIILYQLYMPSYFLGTFTEYPWNNQKSNWFVKSMSPVPPFYGRRGHRSYN